MIALILIIICLLTSCIGIRAPVKTQNPFYRKAGPPELLPTNPDSGCDNYYIIGHGYHDTRPTQHCRKVT